MRVTTLSSFAIALALAASALAHAATAKPDPVLDAPPAGLVPATVKLSVILAKHDASTGAQPTSLTEDWTYVDTGLHGTEHLVRSGTDYHSKIKSDAQTDEYGQLAGARWHKDTYGFTTPNTGTEDASFYVLRAIEDASDPKNDVELAGRTTGASPANVVKVTVPGAKHPEWIFFDASTYRIVRVERVAGKHRIAASYDDFRTTDGVTQAWHVHDSYWVPEYDDDYRMTSFKAGGTVSPSEFAPPANPVVTDTTARGPLPSQFPFLGAIIVRITVGGRGLDFEIDPSVRYNMIDEDVAQQLGLPSFGKSTQLSTGERIPYDTILPSADLGPIHLQNFPVYATDIAWRPDDSTKIVGTLGYDFLASHVIHVDYVHRLVEVLPTSALPPAPAKPIAHALDIPLQFDDGALLVPMAIGDGFTEHALLNTGMPWTVVFGNYVDAHADTLKGAGGAHTSSFVPFADSASYGKTIDTWIVHTNVLSFANLNFSDLPIIATEESYDDRSIDAVVGYDYLAFYDIYFDYPHDRLLLVPNDRFYKATGKVKPDAP
jgi:hypothetical protein